MRERVERLLGTGTRGMWVMTFHAACARILRAEAAAARLHAPVHDLRPGRRAAAGQALGRRRRRRPQALHAGGDPQPDLRGEEPADRRRDLPPGGRLAVRGDDRRRLRHLRARPAPHERDGLRRPAVPHGQPAGAVRGGPRALPQRLPPRARRRVPGHQPRPVPAAAAARRRRAAAAARRRRAGRSPDLRGPGRSSQPGGRRRRRAVDLQLPRAPTSATSSTSRRTSRTRAWSSSSRTTARPRRSCRRPTP